MKDLTHEVIISLGSNIEPANNLRLALLLMREILQIEAVAQVWETPPVGTKGANYYNSAVQARTDRYPLELKNQVLRPIELKLGRVRTSDKYAPRPIDLDVIIFDGQLIDERIWSLAYMAIPISELMPEYQQSETGRTLAEVARDLLKTNRVILHPNVFVAEN